MPNIGKSIREEIVRLARKESKSATAPLHKTLVVTRKGIVTLKRQVLALEAQIKQLLKCVGTSGSPAPIPETENQRRYRLTAKGLRSLRKSLRLTGAEFAQLLGVSTQAVYAWERKQGPVRLRSTTKAAVLSVRGLGAKGARARLAETQAVKSASKKARKSTRKRAAKK